jgi:hypothetical protein
MSAIRFSSCQKRKQSAWLTVVVFFGGKMELQVMDIVLEVTDVIQGC